MQLLQQSPNLKTVFPLMFDKDLNYYNFQKMSSFFVGLIIPLQTIIFIHFF